MESSSNILRNRLLITMILPAFLLLSNAQAQFVEDVQIIHTITGPGPDFGWAVADLEDIDGDGVTDFITGTPRPGAALCRVYSGRTGLLIYDLIPSFAGGGFGYGLADAGDVDNDGVHDIVVGANTSGSSGRAYIFSGSTGLEINMMNGFGSGSNFGRAVGCAGDVNSDGFDDVIIGAPNDATLGSTTGRAYIYSGIDGALIRALNGESAGDLFGRGIGGIGDIDGDAIGDQIVGAPGAGTNGKAYVYSGVDGSLIFETFADAGAVAYGEFFTAGVGDVNNDGTGDFYVGDYDANNQRGRAYVYSGATGTAIHVFVGQPGDGLGPGRGAGDVNLDGFEDLIIGSWSHSTGANLGGRVNVYSGYTKKIMQTMTGNVSGGNLGFDAVGVGDVNADGAIDFLITAGTVNTVYVIAGEGCGTLPDTPIAEPEPSRKSRYLSFDPVNPGIQTAIRVMLTDLDGFADSNRQVRWVGPPQEFPEGGTPVPTFMAAQLQCEPYFQDWGSVGMLHVYGKEVVPNSTYDVQTFIDIDDCPSAVLTVYTSRYGDIVEPFNPPLDIAQPNIGDVLATVDKWLGTAVPIKARAQVQPEIINPSLSVSIADVLAVVDSWLGAPYSYDGPTACP